MTACTKRIDFGEFYRTNLTNMVGWVTGFLEFRSLPLDLHMDILHDSCIVVLNHLHLYRGNCDMALKMWVVLIARGIVMSIERHKGLRPESGGYMGRWQRFGPEHELADPRSDAASILVHFEELRDMVIEGIEDIPNSTYLILERIDLCRSRANAEADRLGISHGVARKRLQRARAHLRAAIERRHDMDAYFS